jgi:aryl-alcohol dehydrogenase-like predicted oxidoreductase
MTPRMMRIQVPTNDAVERTELAPGFTVSRISTGLRPVSGTERDGEVPEPELTSTTLDQYLDAGFTTFAMANDYASGEVIAGPSAERGRMCRFLSTSGTSHPTIYTRRFWVLGRSTDIWRSVTISGWTPMQSHLRENKNRSRAACQCRRILAGEDRVHRSSSPYCRR